ncbi:aldehyde dehydrogenase family protein [Microvirga sp. Mcv34]|uniref:aldehyde dehydrogenase family protein n=1 Tax=Microvirga sp. Mcv34 TaxID=2926016 RepID=UPI0021CA932A|nr:aldehyde dehydrogenase family protein [Microvirga sp. Mcv34]
MVRVWRVVEALESGIAGVNTPALASAMAPFGRVKQSGLTHEGCNSSLEGFLEIDSSGRAGSGPQE